MSDGFGAVPATLAAALADRYRLERELGAGGMATVYLAHDLKLGRPAAIKVLRDDLGTFVGSTLGAARFHDEIRTTAKLQHPHILSLLDSGEADGRLYYVMPFIEGESLRARLERERQLPVTDALRIAGEVADALAHAHANGIVHRDVKPENILLQSGRALVADFGIALATGDNSDERRTSTGLSLGTPRYKSPEQAAGVREIDARTDIFSLGAVLYEMLTGEPPFDGATADAITNKLLTQRPMPPSHIRPAIPSAVEEVLLRALERNPADRFQRIEDLRLALESAVSGSATRGITPPHGHVVTPDRRGVRVVAAALGIALIALASRALAPFPRGPQVWDVVLPDSAPILFTPRIDGAHVLDVASDASFAVYIAKRGTGREIWWRSLVTSEARPISGTAGALVLSLSPNDEEIIFVADSALRVVGVEGGASRVVADAGDPASIDWLAADSVLVTFGLRWISPARGWLGSMEFGCWTPKRRPDGRLLCSDGHVLLAEAPEGDRTLNVVAGDGAAVSSGTRLRGTNPIPLDNERFIFLTRDGDLMAAALSGDSTASAPVPVANGISTDELWGGGQIVLADNGTLVYAPGPNIGLGQLVATRGDGLATPLIESAEYFREFSVSPDGRSLATSLRSAEGDAIAVFDIATGRRTDWLRSSYPLESPSWTPDGELLAGLRRRRGSWVHLRGRPLSGRAPDTLDLPSNVWMEEVIGRDSLLAILPGIARTLVHVHRSAGAWRIDTILPAFGGFAPAISPDRRSVAYTDIHDGRWEVFVTSFPDGARTVKLSNSGGIDAVWVTNDQLAFFDDYSWYRVRVGPGPERTVTRPRPWFRDERFLDTGGRSAILLADGRLAYVRRLVPETGTHLRVVRDLTTLARNALKESPRR